MNPHIRLLPLLTVTIFLCSTALRAEPIDFSEVSLLVRARESKAAIVQEVSNRKLVRPLTAQQENTLKAQGASDSLIQALHQSNLALSANELSALEARREANKNRPPAPATRNTASAAPSDSADDLHVFEVAVGHPINLSQWGGPDYELTFRERPRLDDGCPDAMMIDNANSYTHTATYLGVRAEGWLDDRRSYTSIMDHSFTRGIHIDRRHPVSVKGSPYLLYPVYAAGGVSLYYIGGSLDYVKLAVSTSMR